MDEFIAFMIMGFFSGFWWNSLVTAKGRLEGYSDECVDAAAIVTFVICVIIASIVFAFII